MVGLGEELGQGLVTVAKKVRRSLPSAGTPFVDNPLIGGHVTGRKPCCVRVVGWV